MSIPEQPVYHGREAKSEALGRTWIFSRWTKGLIDLLTDWAKTKLPDPLQVADCEVVRLQKLARAIRDDETLSEDEKAEQLAENLARQDRIASLAMEQATSYLAFNSPRFQSLLAHPDGTAYLFYLLMRPNHPDITPEAAHEVVKALGDDEANRIMEVTAGKPPKVAKGKRGNAKAPAK